MTSPPGEYGFHPFQVWDVEFTRCVVCFQPLDALKANALNQSNPELNRVPA